MAYKLIIKPLVFTDVEEAFKWYNKQIDGLGSRYYNQFWITIENIKSHPFIFSYLKAPVRKCRMKTFPYKIYYIVEKETIIILGVAHHKRSNAYIRRRLS